MKNLTIFILILLVLNSCTLSFFKKSTEAKKIGNPELSPAPGSFTTNQNITLSSENGAYIRYTIDGTLPAKDSGLIYSAPVELSSGTVTIKAIAYKDDYLDSDVVSGVYNINVVADPVIIPNDKFLAPSTTVSISTTTQGAIVRYTLDGSTPTQSWGNIFSSAFTINSNTTVKAIAYKSGYGDSQVVTANLKMVNGICADPVLTPNAGTYNPNQEVSISCSTSGSSIKYTKDGTDPSSTNGTLYTVPIVLTQTTTIKAIATADNYLDSQIVSLKYTISNFPSSGLVAQWLFSGNADDTSGNNLNGTNYGCTLTKDRFGNDNNAYSFSGTSYVEVAHDDKLNCYPISFSVWVKTFDNENDPVFKRGNWDGGFYELFCNLFRCKTTGSQSYLGTSYTSSIYDYKWHHLFSMFNDTGIIIYYDGVFLLKKDWDVTNTKLFNLTEPLYIGRSNLSSYDRKFNGSIDDFRIYNRALTDSEIQELYKEGGWSGN